MQYGMAGVRVPARNATGEATFATDPAFQHERLTALHYAATNALADYGQSHGEFDWDTGYMTATWTTGKVVVQVWCDPS